MLWVKDAGYEVEMVGVSLPGEEAIVRATTRAVRSGRWVPNDVLLDAHRKFSQNFEQIVGLLDDIKLFDNGGATPELIARKIKGKFTIIKGQEKAYATFLRKGNLNEKANTLREVSG